MTIALKNGTVGTAIGNTGFIAVPSDCGNDYTGDDGKVLLARVPFSKRKDKPFIATALKEKVEKHLESLTNNADSLYEEHVVFKGSKEPIDSDYTDNGILSIGGISKREQVTITIKAITTSDKKIGSTGKTFGPVDTAAANGIYGKELKTEKVLQLAVPADVSAALALLVKDKAGLATAIVAGDAANGVANQNDVVLLSKDLTDNETNTASIVVNPDKIENGKTYYLAKRTGA